MESPPRKTLSDDASLRNAPEDDKRYILKLFIIGTRPNSSRAVVNVRKLLEEHLPGKYELEVVDILLHPERVKEAQIIAAPTLIKELPLPLRRFIGNMSDSDRLKVGLEIRGH